MSIETFEVAPDRLNLRCDPDSLGFETTEEVAALDGMIGQDRAVSALELALAIEEPGFNLFISGPPGTGRNTALRAHVERVAARKDVPADWGYTFNFQNPSQPVPIALPCGRMRTLADDMNQLVDTVRRDVSKVFESSEYTERMEEAMRGLEARRKEMTDGLDSIARESGFGLRPTPAGIVPFPVREGRPLSEAEYNEMSDEEREVMSSRLAEFQRTINRTMIEINSLGREAQAEAREVDREIVRFTLMPIIDELQQKYADHAAVIAYLDEVEADMVQHLDAFKPSNPAASAPWLAVSDEDLFVRYRVNDLVDNTACEHAPVVFENNPTYYNLFGRVDYRARMGTLVTDHTMIRSGAMHEANGGFLILQAHDLLTSPLAWETLKRTLRSGEIRVENIGEQFSQVPSATLRPPADTGGHQDHHHRHSHHIQAVAEFRRGFPQPFQDSRLFRYRDGTVLLRTSPITPLLSPPAAVRGISVLFTNPRWRGPSIIPVGLAEHQQKLATRFRDVGDILTEANYWAKSAGSPVVMGEHVNKAIEQRRYRSGITEDRLREMIEEGIIHIATDGLAVGQLNGLAVLGFGDVAFGMPNRITARVSLGRGNLVNVERETKLSGRIHDKGFMILAGYLRGKYGYDKPLSLNASIGFEQSYSEVDGDSASSTELYALLSAISEIPVTQGIAVTGSVDQNGNIQAIGGVTQKVEGFYEVCKVKGLTGSQGVLLPRDNINHLCLTDEVVDAVQEGRFHIYAVSTIDEGLEVLTGVPAGLWDESKGYPEGTVHEKVERRLAEMTRTLQELARGHGEEADLVRQPASEATGVC